MAVGCHGNCISCLVAPQAADGRKFRTKLQSEFFFCSSLEAVTVWLKKKLGSRTFNELLIGYDYFSDLLSIPSDVMLHLIAVVLENLSQRWILPPSPWIQIFTSFGRHIYWHCTHFSFFLWETHPCTLGYLLYSGLIILFWSEQQTAPGIKCMSKH